MFIKTTDISFFSKRKENFPYISSHFETFNALITNPYNTTKGFYYSLCVVTKKSTLVSVSKISAGERFTWKQLY